jgi:hypothetical protein
MTSRGDTSSPRRFRSSSRSRQSCALSRAPSVKPSSSFAAFRRRADQHQDALLFVFDACLEMDAIGPDVDVALRRQIALLPRGVLVEPTSFSRPMADADNPAASLPSSAARASEKSPVEIPFR